MFSTMKLCNECIIKDIPIGFDCIYFDSLIARARNAAVAGFLNQKDSTHLLFVDTDINFKSEDVFKMLERDKEVVCGLYPKKYISKIKLDYVSNLYKKLPNNYESLCTDFSSEVSGDAEKVKYAATGFMLIKKEAILKIIEKFPNTKYKNDIDAYNHYGDNFYNLFPCEINPETKKYESEDYGFSRLWRETGGEIFIEKSAELTHYGWKGYVGNVNDQIKLFNNGNSKKQ
jgi:hypothetical protein